ncbi:hypothetical protein QYE76_063855 [Lolium multiflorum]|uniref:Integrase catalytic domain-containing protein n=1 Tax=Lolium multiflorum TaxID=4521 RepID=A0AAD8S7V1_LOLMU|nr:hypothetical protein QYE76_063855 [Lolium multiflorum]
MQEESLVECLRMSKEKVTCCDHEEEIASLKRSEAKLMEVNSMQEEALKEYFPLSKDRACCNHEGDIAKMESDKRLLMKMNSLQEEALMEHFRVNKAKEVQVFDITHPHPEHEDEVNRLKAKIDRLQIQAKYLEGVIEAKDGANEGSCNEGGVATKTKRKRSRRTKKKKNKENMEINHEESDASSRRDGVPNSASKGFAGSNNPSHVLFVDYYGHIRARFIGPQEDNDYASGGAKWVVDSGATSHMTGSKVIVVDLMPSHSWACVQGKMHGAPHKAKTIISTTRCLELLHVDLFGPPSHESLGGKKYCLVIVDDYSRYCWVFFFKYKSETQRTMMEFANQVQRKYNTTILAIRSDNGMEFKNYTLDDFLGEEGIQHQYSSPYTPQQNGVAERKNRTLIEAARTMMMEYKSNYNFWAEAISTACHATNRLYFRKGLEKTPYEILTGNKPNVSYFKVFGCKCYVLVKDTRLSKFDSRAQEGIFVGYATDSHAYRVFNKSNGRVVESCDVTFDEDDISLEE